MRELTEAERVYWYRVGRWPCCWGTGYLRGPAGGIMRNIKCPRCGTKMNVLDPEDSRYWGNLWVGQMLEEPPGYKPPRVPGKATRVMFWLWSFVPVTWSREKT